VDVYVWMIVLKKFCGLIHGVETGEVYI
jgi:hypothetical protein